MRKAGQQQLEIHWQHPENMPGLLPGQIDIWRLDLNELPCHHSVLASEEASRLEGYRYASGHHQYCTTRTALRSILGRYLGCPPALVPLTRLPGGKPTLAISPPQLYFNLSHAEDIALLAVCADHRVGVDVEIVRPLPDLQRIAQRIFSKTDITSLENSAWNPNSFYQLWTALEARQKCLGRGVFGKLVLHDQVKTRGFQLAEKQVGAVAWPAHEASPRLIYYRP